MSNIGFGPVNIGFGNIVLSNRMVAVISPESAPVKRFVQESREAGTLVDATYGRKTRSIVITDGGYIILSALQPETISMRISADSNAD